MTTCFIIFKTTILINTCSKLSLFCASMLNIILKHSNSIISVLFIDTVKSWFNNFYNVSFCDRMSTLKNKEAKESKDTVKYVLYSVVIYGNMSVMQV